MQRLFGGIMVAVGLSFTACGQADQRVAAVPLEGRELARALVDQRFTAQSISVDGSEIALDRKRPVSIDVRAEFWSFDTNCNGHGAPARIDNGKLRFAPSWGSTLRGCPAPETLREETIGRLIRSVPTVAFDGVTLVISGDGVRLEAKPSQTLPPTKPPDESAPSQTLPPGVEAGAAPSAGTFQVDDVAIEGKAATTAPATIQMAGNSVIVIDSGCNRLQAIMSLQADGWRGDFVTTTYEPCDPETAAFERELIERLDSFVVTSDGTNALIVTSRTLQLHATRTN